MDNYICPLCNHPNQAQSEEWQKIGYVPILCSACDHLFWAKLPSAAGQPIEIVTVNRVPVFTVQLPDIPEDTIIYVVNKQHPKHLEPGVVTKRAHCHYRIKFNDGLVIWMPSHWIERCPW
jgi:hypothetical protein